MKTCRFGKTPARLGALLVVTLGAVTVGITAGGTASAAPAQSSWHGTFRETPAGAGLGYDIAGSAKLTVGSGGTSAKVNISGLDPLKAYGSHVHNGTCASGGGGHYQNTEDGLTTPPNELWLSSTDNPLGALAPNPGGVADGAGAAIWAARTASTTQTNARSIIVHEPVSGTRIACADLS